MNMTSPRDWLVALLVLVVAVACLRLLWWQWRGPPRAHPWRLVLLLAMQPLCVFLLYRTFAPPPIATERGTLTVLTAGVTREQLSASTQGEVLVALPEAPVLRGAEPMPDLATALRRYPGTARIHVVGAGLESRDRDAAIHLPLAFDPAPLPDGVTGLWMPTRIAAGDGFRIAGRVHGVADGSVELVDPAGLRVDASSLTAIGAFELGATARAPGTATFTLRVRDAGRGMVEELELPLWVADAPAPRVLLLAGAPNPELRALRRWITDAGMTLHAQVAVGGGLQFGDAPLSMDVETLGGFDLVVLDERAWATLGDGPRSALLTAVREGLGVLLRVTGPLPQHTRAQLNALGFDVSADSGTAALVLPQPEGEDEDTLHARLGPGSEDAPLDVELAADPPPRLLRRDLRIGSGDVVPVHGIAAEPWLYWRAEGRGRIALATIIDSYRLPLSGRGDLHAGLWSAAFATVARGITRTPGFQPDAREGVRTRICNVAQASAIVAPDGATARLLPDPAAGPGRCAAYWPRTPGWHRLRHGDDSWPFFVRASDDAPGLRAMELSDATLSLAGDAAHAPTRADASAAPRRGSSWPWFLAWLASIAVLWWLERWRRGARIAR